jgi:hypothetical protein
VRQTKSRREDEMKKGKENCIIAGGGPAGVEVAALLAKLKPELRPVLFDKDLELGGRCKSYYIDGSWFDFGQHYTIAFGEYVADWPQIYSQPKCAELAGANVVYQSVEPGGVAFLHPAFPGKVINQIRLCPLTPEFDRNLAKTFFPYLNDGAIAEAEGLYQALLNEIPELFLKAVQHDFDLSILPPITIDEWLGKRAHSELAASFFKSIAAYNAAIPVEDIGNSPVYAMGAMFVALNIDLLRYAYPVNPQLPKYGAWGAEIYAFRDAFLSNGGRIFLGTAVKKIIIENGKVKGVIVERDGEEEHIETELVICEIPPPQALDSGVLDEKAMPKDWVAGIRSTERKEKELYNTGFVIAHFTLKKPLTHELFWTIVLDEKGEMVGSIEWQRNSDSAPAGKQAISFMRWLRVDNIKMNMKTAQDILNDYFLPHLRLHWKNFDDHVENCLIHFHPYVWDQVLIYHPEAYTTPIKVPGVEGLYYVGNWSRAGFILTSRSAHSAVKCAEMILGKKLV